MTVLCLGSVSTLIGPSEGFQNYYSLVMNYQVEVGKFIAWCIG